MCLPPEFFVEFQEYLKLETVDKTKKLFSLKKLVFFLQTELYMRVYNLSKDDYFELGKYAQKNEKKVYEEVFSRFQKVETIEKKTRSGIRARSSMIE